MKLTIASVLLICLLALPGCSSETSIAGNFLLPKGTHINLQTDIKVAYAHSGLYFDLSGIPETKKDRDFTDFISLELIDEKGKSYRPRKIWDINGNRRNIVAFCDNIPKGTNIKMVSIVALQDLDGSKIRWWTGNLK
jgi:hypothetical protein